MIETKESRKSREQSAVLRLEPDEGCEKKKKRLRPRTKKRRKIRVAESEKRRRPRQKAKGRGRRWIEDKRGKRGKENRDGS